VWRKGSGARELAQRALWSAGVHLVFWWGAQARRMGHEKEGATVTKGSGVGGPVIR
jgi:hypothetical protein